VGWMARIQFLVGTGIFLFVNYSVSYLLDIRVSFPHIRSGWSMKLTTHFHVASRSRMPGVLPHTVKYIFMARCLSDFIGLSAWILDVKLPKDVSLLATLNIGPSLLSSLSVCALDLTSYLNFFGYCNNKVKIFKFHLTH